MKICRPSWTLTILTFALLVTSPAAAQQMAPDIEGPIQSWTNLVRMQQGLRPLSGNAQLALAAQMHAWNMAAQETMSHTLNGTTPADRVHWTGYAHSGVAENVAYNFGYQHPAWQLFQGWMTSDGHRRNILNEQFTEIGIGVAQSRSGKYYACQVFGRPVSALPYPVSYPPRRAYPTTWTQPQPQAVDDFHWHFTPRWDWR